MLQLEEIKYILTHLNYIKFVYEVKYLKIKLNNTYQLHEKTHNINNELHLNKM